MKKCFIFICILVIIGAALPVSAADDYIITIMDSDIALSMPAGYDTITRDLDEYSSILKKYNVSREDILSTMRAENRYLEARNQKTGNELMVTSFMNKNSINLWSYGQKQHNTITQSASSLKKSMQEGVDIQVYETPGGYKFFKYIYGLDDPQSIVYATVENGRNIEIAAYTYNGTYLQPEDIAALQEVVDSFDVLTKMVSKDYVEPPNPIVVAAIIAAAAVLIIVAVVIARKKNMERRAALAEKKAQMAFNSWRAADEWEEDEKARVEVKSSDSKKSDEEEQALQELEKRNRGFAGVSTSNAGYVHRVPKKKKSRHSKEDGTHKNAGKAHKNGTAEAQSGTEAASGEPDKKP